MHSVYRKLDIIGVAYVSLDGVILECNKRFALLQGDDPTHLVGQNVVDITAPEDKDRARKNLQALASGTESIQHDKRYVNRSGETVKCRAQFVRTETPKGEVFITSFVFEHDPGDSDAARLLMYEKYIEELLGIISRSQGLPEINLTMRDNSVNATADHGSTVNQTAGSSKNFLIVAVVAIAMVAIALGAFIYGGSFTATDGENTIEINKEDEAE